MASGPGGKARPGPGLWLRRAIGEVASQQLREAELQWPERQAGRRGCGAKQRQNSLERFGPREKLNGPQKTRESWKGCIWVWGS